MESISHFFSFRHISFDIFGLLAKGLLLDISFLGLISFFVILNFLFNSFLVFSCFLLILISSLDNFLATFLFTFLNT